MRQSFRVSIGTSAFLALLVGLAVFVVPDNAHATHQKHRIGSTEVVGKIMYLRQSYHFGPQKIAMYLKRYHEVTISPSGVWRVLSRLGMGRLPSSQRYKRHEQRWKRYEKP